MIASTISSNVCASVHSRRIPTARAAKPVASRRAQHSRRQHKRVVFVQAAEEATTATATDPAAEQAPSGSAPEALTPIQAAREALDQENIDRVGLETALSDLDAELARLNEAAAAAESKAANLESAVATAKDQLLRLNADFDNFRRRSSTEKDALADNVRGDVIQQLLPLIDNFEAARTQVKAETDAEIKINNSYQGLYKQLVDMMRGLGIEAVPTVNTPFDPEIHEAIMREPSTEVPDGTVLVEFRKGFRIGDKLIRPAMVKVSVDESGSFVSSQEE